MDFNNLPVEIQSTILFEGRVHSMAPEHLTTAQQLKEELVLTSPLKEDEFVELCRTLPSISVSSVRSTSKRTLLYDTRSHITGLKGDMIQSCFIIVQHPKSIYFSSSIECEERTEEFQDLGNNQPIPFLTSTDKVFDTKSTLYILSSRCNKVGIQFREEFILNHLDWICKEMESDPVRLFSYLYSELVLRRCNVLKYYNLLFKDVEPVDSQSEYHETQTETPITKELKEKCKSCIEEMKTLVCKYLKFEMSLL
jgi:hypothetical protein